MKTTQTTTVFGWHSDPNEDKAAQEAEAIALEMREHPENFTPAPAQAQHSPLPWKIDEAYDLPLAIIEDTENGYGVCELEFGDTEQAKANARLIVRACNNAQRLAEALTFLIRCSERGLDQSATHEGLTNCKEIADAREALAEWSKQ